MQGLNDIILLKFNLRLILYSRTKEPIMAKLKSILSKEISGRIGDLIFYQRYGTDCIRSMPSSYRDKKSEKQILHRNRFSAMVRLFHIYRHALRFEIKEKNSNLFTTFFKLNWKNVSVDLDTVNINHEKMILTNQLPIQLSGLEITKQDKQVSFKWKDDQLLDETFSVLCAVYCKEINQVFVSMVKRNASSAIVHLPTATGEIISYTYTFRKTV